jgi:hypothetical protein
MSWPSSPGGSSDTVLDVFGPRPFTPHIATVGYDYDFHRGIDVDVDEGEPLYSPVSGAVSRLHYTHFGWQHANHLEQFTQTGLSATITAGVLRVTCTRDGAASFPSGIDTLQATSERIHPEGDDWTLEVELSAAPSVTGAIGIGLFNAAKSEYIALEYDGTTFTRRGVGTTTFTANGTTASASGKTWLRVGYTVATDTFDWLHSTDGTTWTSLGTETSRSFSATGPSMIPTLYWRSGDTNATPHAIDVVQLNWVDDYLNIGRFGNWLHLTTPTFKVVLIHFETLVVRAGDFVSPGTLLGYAGKTGFDARSGRIQSEHCHVEIVPDTQRDYTNTAPVNPLASTYLPRTNVSNNVTASVTTATDPDGVTCWKLAISVARGDQDFDLNAISLTANLATRTVNWDTRSGLNADNDIPKQSGVYIVPAAFDGASANYAVDVYFSKAVVGSSLSSWSVLDTAGATLASG